MCLGMAFDSSADSELWAITLPSISHNADSLRFSTLEQGPEVHVAEYFRSPHLEDSDDFVARRIGACGPENTALKPHTLPTFTKLRRTYDTPFP